MAAAKKTKASPEVKEESLYDRVSRDIEEKRIYLSKSLNTEVHAACFPLSSDDRAIIFLKEPEFMVQKMAMDMALRGAITDAAELILNTCIIKEESDDRVWCDDAEKRYPKLRLGAIMRSKDLVGYYEDALKKK